MAFDPPWETGEVLQGIPEGTSHAKGLIPYKDRKQADYSPKMQDRRDKFINAYLITFNRTQAGIMCGIPEASLSQQIHRLWHEEYVQKRIQKGLELIDESTLVSRNMVLAGLLKEANDLGPGSSHAARVGAWDKLAKILGMEITKTEISTPTGVNLNVTISG